MDRLRILQLLAHFKPHTFSFFTWLYDEYNDFMHFLMVAQHNFCKYGNTFEKIMKNREWYEEILRGFVFEYQKVMC